MYHYHQWLILFVVLQIRSMVCIHLELSKGDHLPNMQLAFGGIFGQGMWIIVGSLTAFLVSQIVDVTIFHKIKNLPDTAEAYRIPGRGNAGKPDAKASG